MTPRQVPGWCPARAGLGSVGIRGSTRVGGSPIQGLHGNSTLLAANAISMMPLWTRRALSLPYLPVAEAFAVRLGGHALVRGIRWALG